MFRVWTTQLLIIAGLLFISSCSLFYQKTYTWDWRRDHSRYDQIAKELILSEYPALLTTVPTDIQNYEPDYVNQTKAQRLEFWSLFLSVISWMESSHRTEHFYEEKGITDSSGQNVTSRGLLQFSYESSMAYNSNIKKPEDLHIPEVTLRAGVLALKRFLTQDCVISSRSSGQWQGAARYWNVLRNNPKHLKIKQWLKNADYEEPKNNIIPPPPHLKQIDYTPYFQRLDWPRFWRVKPELLAE